MGSDFATRNTVLALVIWTLNYDLWASLKVGGRSFFVLSVLVAVLAWKLTSWTLISEMVVKILSQHFNWTGSILTLVSAIYRSKATFLLMFL